eukprot:9670-Heterococcus_DN1.PRE.1
MVTVSSGANISTAPPRPAHTFPVNVQLSMTDAPASATAPASLAVLLAKVQPLSATAAAAYTAPPAAVFDDKVGSLTRLCKCSDTRDQRLCEYLWTSRSTVTPVAARATVVLLSAKLRAA